MATTRKDIRTEPGCEEGPHTYYWIACAYCEANKQHLNESLHARLRMPRTPFGKAVEAVRRLG